MPPSRGEYVCWWIEQHLVHGEGDFFGRPFKLTKEQRLFIYRAYELIPAGTRRYRRVLRGRPKGDGKTELAAALGCVELGAAGQHGFPASPSIPVAAASFEQADLLFGAARTMISEGPLAPFFDVFDTEILRKDGPGRMYRVAAAAGTNDGQRPTFFLADEVHEWVGNKERVHLVLSNGLAKRRESWELNISTAGHDKDTLLGRMYDEGRQIEAGEIDDPEFLMDWLEAPEGYDLDDPAQLEGAIRSCNPHADLLWPIENVARRYRQIPRFEFERYHLNRWTEGAESWLPSGGWEACEEAGASIPTGAEITVGIDIGTRSDNSALVLLHEREDGRLVVEAQVFAPKGDGSTLELATVDAALHKIAEKYVPTAVVFDKWAFERSAQDFEDMGLPMQIEPMSVERMTRDSQNLYDAIVSQRIVHNGDPVLAGHVKAGATKLHEHGWRLVKNKASRKIDALIALSLAYVPHAYPPDWTGSLLEIFG